MAQLTVEIESLTYNYGGPPVLSNVNLKLEKGSRCLLVGGNGTGKSTLLRIMAGKHMTRQKVKILGCDAYESTPQTLTYLGGEWANNPVVRRDVSVPQLLSSANADKYPERRDYLMELLDVDLDWHLHQVSDGERRRVQLLMGLVQPYDVLLLDEVTVDLDVLVRRDFLNFLKSECETRGVTIVYATHIFDGIGDWATHLAHLENGTITKFGKLQELPDLEALRTQRNSAGRLGDESALLLLVEQWLRKEFEERRKARKTRKNVENRTRVERRGLQNVQRQILQLLEIKFTF
eukprot:Phypoly_transcript_15637.p1 GENE.Phypoly_transcript_15637~~Phypoly_transcript_15637.p1  ORF type:complete len:292 (+),score=44.51 Phypoly_transcript_15637:33-908(+)